MPVKLNRGKHHIITAGAYGWCYNGTALDKQVW